MFSALIATSLWLQLASYFGWPVSTTHAIVGAILGFGCLVGGINAVQWKEVSSIALSWVISPGISGILSFIAFTFLQKKVLYAFDPVQATKKILPYLVFAVIAVFLTATLFDGLENLDLELSLSSVLLIASTGGFLAFLVAKYLIRRNKFSASEEMLHSSKTPYQLMSVSKALRHLERLKMSASGAMLFQVDEAIGRVKSLSDQIEAKSEDFHASTEYATVEKMFAYLQIMSACFVAFAHGANDVANAIGPVASVLEILQHPYDFVSKATIPSWLLALGGVGIVIGLATWGWRVIETIGKKITELTPTRGFCAEFGAAVTILIASKLGFPISTTHCIVGAVLGVGLAKGISALNLRMLREIVLSWVVTIPSSAITCILLYYLIKTLLGSASIF
jgi:phosphate/sulfate permease